MRARRLFVSLSIAAAALAFPRRASAESVRTLHVELGGSEAARFGIENLVGTMRVSPGERDSLEVIATVHAEKAELADAVRLERVPGQQGVTLRVRYPYDRVRTFRYREPGQRSGDFSLWFVSSNEYSYDGRTVRVSPGRGVLLHADLEVKVPRHSVQALFRNLVGLIRAEGIDGSLRFEVESADLRLDGVGGEIALRGSSGDIRAHAIHGNWSSQFTSGDCDLREFTGESASFETTSGDVQAQGVQARLIRFTSSSGDASLRDTRVEDFEAKATSGDVSLESPAETPRRIQVTTSSGDVRLRLPADAHFEAEATQSSGDASIGYTDTSLQRTGRRSVYRRGTGGAQIRIHTSSGDLSLRPR